LSRARVAWNSASATVLFVTNVIISFVMAPTYVHSLGQEGYGIWELMIGLVGYLGILELGVGPAMTRYIAVARGKEDPTMLQQVFSAGLLTFISAGIVGGLLLTLTTIDPSLVLNSQETSTRELRFVLVIFALNFAVSFARSAFICMLMGSQAHAIVNSFRLCLSLVMALLIWNLLHSDHEQKLLVVACAALGGVLVELLAFSLIVRLRYRSLRFTLRSTRDTVIELFRFGAKSASLIGASNFFRSGLLFVLAHATSVANVVFYVFPARLVEYSQSLSLTMSLPLEPYFADVIGRGGVEATRDTWVVATRVMQFVTFGMFLGMVWLGLPFLTLWMGAEYAQRGAVVFFFLCGALFAQALAANSLRLLIGAGRHGAAALSSAIIGVVCLLAAYPLAKSVGIEGIAIAALAYTVVQSIYEIHLVCNYLTISPLQHVARAVKAYVPPLVVASAVFYALLRVDSPNSFPDLVLHGVLGGSTYLAACAVFAMSGGERAAVLGFIRSKRASR